MKLLVENLSLMKRSISGVKFLVYTNQIIKSNKITLSSPKAHQMCVIYSLVTLNLRKFTHLSPSSRHSSDNERNFNL